MQDKDASNLLQKKDVYNHLEKFDTWKDGLTNAYIEEGLSKDNSDYFVAYFKWLGERKSKGYCNRNRSKVKSIMVGLQRKGFRNITKITLVPLEEYFFEWRENHSVDYIKRWNAFWSWYAQTKRREGKVVADLTLKIKDFEKKEDGESIFVWVTKDEFDNFRKYFDEDKQTILLFIFDTLIRAPTELLSVKRENIYEKNGEVWIDIPKEISKTIGRKFNLVYSGQAILDYIKRHDKKQGDYLFNFSPPVLNQEMQRIAKQLWDGKKSEGGEFYKNITLYDLRHSGAVHFRQLFQKTGQSLDLLRERGGWSDFKMINYYTKRLGLTGHISKEKLLLEEDRTKLQKDFDDLKEEFELMKQSLGSQMKINKIKSTAKIR